MYPSARAFSRRRSSRVTIVTTCGASPSSSIVARCTASSVRIGSMGNGRRTRASTAWSTSRMKQRRSNGRLFFCHSQPSSCARPDDCPACLCEGQRRRHVLCSGRHRLHRRRVTFQQGRNQRARLQVPNARHTSLGPASTRRCFRTRASTGGATFRHGRGRSVQRRCPTAAGCPASPRTGHQLPLGDGGCRLQ